MILHAKNVAVLHLRNALNVVLDFSFKMERNVLKNVNKDSTKIVKRRNVVNVSKIVRVAQDQMKMIVRLVIQKARNHT